MSSINPLDRLSLCHFTFADGRRCRTPRLSTHPNYCHYHVQLEAQSKLSAQLADEISQLLANPNLSSNQLSSAIARLIPAVLHGHLKIRTARTVAYLLQTLLQTIRLSQSDHLQPAPPPLPPPAPSTPPPSSAASLDNANLPQAAKDVPVTHSAGVLAGGFSAPLSRSDRSQPASPPPNSPAVNAALSVARHLFPARDGHLGTAGACSRFSSGHPPCNNVRSRSIRTSSCAPSPQTPPSAPISPRPHTTT
jgi:hypothetical protein